MPKVGVPLYCRGGGAAPRIGDGAMRSRPYAGNSVNPPLLVVRPGVTTCRWPRRVSGSDNVRGADNQQERLSIEDG